MGQTAKPVKPRKSGAAKSSAKPDRSLMEGGEDYPVRELAVATGISVDEADTLIEKHGVGDKAAKAARVLQREHAEDEGQVRP